MQKVRLPAPGATFPEGTKCNVSGWGMTESNEDSDVLLYANVRIAKDDACFREWGGNRSIILCAGGDAGVGSCHVSLSSIYLSVTIGNEMSQSLSSRELMYTATVLPDGLDQCLF